MKTLILGILPGLIAAPLSAQAQASNPRFQLHIAAQPLGAALREFALETGLQVGRLSEGADENVQVSAVTGQLTASQALDLLLSGTSLQYRFVNDHTIAILRASDGKVLPQGASHEAQSSTREEPRTRLPTESRYQGFLARVAGFFAACGVLSGANHACAQASDADSTQIQEVVVTAQKRIERLQDVPVPVTVLDPTILAERNQSRLQDYSSTVPGLSLAQLGSGQQTIAVRGISTASFANPTVGVTVDDVPYGSSTALGYGSLVVPDFDPSDLSGIEILRGPQGTLYGASSLGGLLKFMTKDPSLDGVSGRVQLVGDYTGHGDAGYGVRGAINMPVSNTVAIRASGFSRRDPGYVDNIALGKSNVNRADVYGGHVSVLWQPSDRLSLKLSAMQQNTDADGSADVDANGFLHPTRGDLKQYRQIAEPYSIVSKLYTATLKAKVGSLDLLSVSGYGTGRYSNTLDDTNASGSTASDYFEVAGAAFQNRFATDKFTQELRLSSPGSQRFEWMVGAFYTHEDTRADQIMGAIDLPSASQVGTLIDYNFPTTVSEYAVFADLTIHFTDRFDVQFGGRQSRNKQVYNETDTGPLVPVYYGEPSPFVNETQRADANEFTYLVTPRFKLSPDIMIYARLASGYRVGGNNVNAVIGGVPQNYQPDKTNNYEIGLKGDWLDHSLSLDASLYYVDWKRIQINLISPDTGFSYAVNGGKAKSQGIELTLQARPHRGLTLSATATVNDAELTEDLSAASSVVGHSGDRLPYSSRFAGNLSVDQEFQFTNGWTGFVGGSISYVGDRAGELVSVYATGQSRYRYSGYSKIDLHAGVRSAIWTADLFMNNVGDKRGVVGGDNNFLTGGQFVIYTQPRAVGLSIARSF